MKYDKILVQKIEQENQQQQKQERLKAKHKIQDKNVVVVEKTVVSILWRTIKIICTIAIFVLATVGLFSLLEPTLRIDVINALMAIFNEMR